MAKLIYSFTMSLDGFIAGAGGDMSWLAEHLGPNPVVDELNSQIGAVLTGGRTLRGDDPYRGTEKEGKVSGGGWDGPMFVLSRQPPAEPVPGLTFVGDLASGIAAAKEAAGDKDVNVIGATVARGCLEAGQLDEVFVCVAPVLLGDGVRMFSWPGGTRVRLEKVAAVELPQVMVMRYRVTG